MKFAELYSLIEENENLVKVVSPILVIGKYRVSAETHQDAIDFLLKNSDLTYDQVWERGVQQRGFLLSNGLITFSRPYALKVALNANQIPRSFQKSKYYREMHHGGLFSEMIPFKINPHFV